MIELIEIAIPIYLGAVIIILAVSLLHTPFKSLKILHSLKYQMLLFLFVWLLGELVGILGGSTILGGQKRLVHFASMFLFAAFATYSMTRLLKVVK